MVTGTNGHAGAWAAALGGAAFAGLAAALHEHRNGVAQALDHKAGLDEKWEHEVSSWMIGSGPPDMSGCLIGALGALGLSIYALGPLGIFPGTVAVSVLVGLGMLAGQHRGPIGPALRAAAAEAHLRSASFRAAGDPERAQAAEAIAAWVTSLEGVCRA